MLQISREMVRRGHEVTVHASDILTETPWTRMAGAGGRESGVGCRGSGAGVVVPKPETRNPRPELIDGIKVVRHKAYIRPLSARWSMLVIPGMLSGLLGEDGDIYHAHSHRYFQLEAAVSAARANGKPLVITPHYHPAEEKETMRTRAMLKLYDLYSSGSIYRHAERVLTMTDLEKRFMASFVPAGKCATVGAGIDPDEWSEVPSAEMFRKEAGLEGRFLLYSGRLATNKGLRTLFDALPAIFKAFDGKMVLLGKDWGMKAELVDRARRGGFEGRVRFIDFLPDRMMYKSALAGCEMLVLPSQWEAFGIVLLEAGMCRRPVVATTVGGVPEVVRHGETGLLVPYGDQGALADSVTGLLADREMMKRMGEGGRRLAIERHTWPRVVDRVLDAYKDALGTGGEA